MKRPGASLRGPKADDKFYVSGNFNTFTVSLSNNPFTSKTINKSSASGLSQRLKGANDRKELVALMSARRLSGGNLDDVMDVAKRLVAIEMKKDADRDIPEFAKMEIVLGAISAKKLSMAEFFLIDLLSSKNAKVRAAALTAQGIIAASDNRLPEAVESWSQAIKAVPGYEPAVLNLGFTAVAYGDFGRAKQLLGPKQGDWFAAYGLITAERSTGDAPKARQLCNRVINQKPNYKPAYYNCALNELQGIGNVAKAEEYIKRMTKIKGRRDLDEKAFLLQNEVMKAKGNSKNNQNPKKK